MFSRTTLCLLALLNIAYASDCCHLIEDVLPSQVAYPASVEYVSQQQVYLSAQQSQLHPTCRVNPRTASDVSNIVKIAAAHQCSFAVKSGGHMSWSMSSNTGPDGFTVDLGLLNSAVLSDDLQIVSVGPGAKCEDVYNILDKQGVSTFTGRVGTVGFGGFLMHGGISFFSQTHGFASGHIINYQIVLSDGRIVHANANSHPDLYWALKMGSTNYGIITRFDLPLVQHTQGETCDAILTFSSSAMNIATKTFSEYFKEAPPLFSEGFQPVRFILGFGWNLTQSEYAINEILTHKCNTVDSYFQAWLKERLDHPEFVNARIPSLSYNNNKTTSLTEIATTSAQLLPPGLRQEWRTHTLKVDEVFLRDLLHEMETVFRKLRETVPSVNEFVTVQPMPRDDVSTDATPSSFVAPDGHYYNWVLVPTWTDEAADAQVYAIVDKFDTWIVNQAKARGLYHPFVYMNYAAPYQVPLTAGVSLTDEGLARMMKTKGKYDPEDVFGKYWIGGFKLPKIASSWGAADRSEL